MTKYFDEFPTLSYNPSGSPSKARTVFTDITFRLKIRDKIKSNIFSYYVVDVSDDDTMEILADKYYGDSEYHWIIALANDIVDPQFDWPLPYRTYLNYIVSKYGTAEAAELQIHHYEKVITRYHQGTRTTSELVLEIQEAEYNTLPETAFRQFDLSDGSTVEETITKRAISASQYEFDLNNRKKQIKIIKKDYLAQVLSEFTAMMSNEQ